jgi:hypothetical protein
MGQENACANQAQKRCNRLNHRKDPLRPAGTICCLAQSKEFPAQIEESDLTDAFVQQICQAAICERTRCGHASDGSEPAAP